MPALSRGAHCASNVSETVRPSTFLARPPISNDADYLPNLAVLILLYVNQILGLVLRIQEPQRLSYRRQRPRPGDHAPAGQAIVQRFKHLIIALPLLAD